MFYKEKIENYINKLESQLQEKEKIIEDAIEYISNINEEEFVETEHYVELLSILERK